MQGLVLARSLRRALLTLGSNESNRLLILPTTVGALELTRALCLRQPCRVTAGPISAEPRWGLAPHLRTPAEIVREFAGERHLNALVISFPDQIAGEGESFVTLRFLGMDRRFSLLEAVLVLRHQPLVYQYRCRRPFGAYRLLEVPYAHALSAADHRTAPAYLLRTLLAGLEAELARPPRDWLAASSFALKSPVTFEVRVREELKEVEALLRLAVDARTDAPDRFEPALTSVTALVRGRHVASPNPRS
jgi:hypothetical protein